MENSFLTFNYDTLIEEALIGLGRDFSYGESLDTATLVGPMLGSRIKKDAPIRVLKLHGSLNFNGGDRGKLTVFDGYRDLRMSGEIPLLIPPTWNKSLNASLRQTWDEGIELLRSATRVVVIGFSMPATDAYIKYFLASGLQNNISLRDVVFVDPAVDEIKARVMSMFAQQPRPRLIAKGVEQFVTQGADTGTVHSIGRGMDASIQNISRA
jgi:hypothetical protein